VRANEKNYQHSTTHLPQSLTKLKAELDSHSGTKEELAAAAAADIILERGSIVDAAMEIEGAKKQLFSTTAELIGAKDDIGILEGLYRRRDFQDTIVEETNDSQLLVQKLNGWASGQGKLKMMACQLFQIAILHYRYSYLQ
jgi:hypothetical protein